MESVFLTGASGKIGSRVLAELLRETNYKIYILLRSKKDKSSKNRLNDILEFWDIDKNQYNERLSILEGDINLPNFGIANHWDNLKNEINYFIHIASSIRLDLSKEKAKELIYDTSLCAYNLALQAKNLKRYIYFSTIEVVGDYQGTIKEEFLTNYKRNFLNTYESAKAEFEEFLKAELEKNVPITIVRPGMLVGESTSGKAYGFQSFYMILEKMMINPDSPILPRSGPINVIPVDILAKCVRLICLDPETIGKIYNFTQGTDDQKNFDEIFEVVKPLLEKHLDIKVKKPIIIHPIFFLILFKFLNLFAFGKLKKFIKIQLIFIKFSFINWKMDNSNTQKLLSKHAGNFPKFSDYIEQLVKYYSQNRHRNRLPF